MKLDRKALKVIRDFTASNTNAKVYVSDIKSGAMIEISQKADWNDTVTAVWVAGNKRFAHGVKLDGKVVVPNPKNLRIEAAEAESAGAFSERMPLFQKTL